MTYTYNRLMTSCVVTIVLIEPVEGKLLVGVRSPSVKLYPNELSLPCGRPGVDDSTDSYETLERAAIRKVFEETNIVISPDQLTPFKVQSDPKLNPDRGDLGAPANIVNVCYLAILNNEQIESSAPGGDLSELVWMSNNLLLETHALAITAFSHSRIALRAIRYHLSHVSDIGKLMEILL